MLDFAKKGFYLGLGLATLTKDKVQSFAKEVAERTKMTEEEGKKFAQYLDAESQKARESLKENIQQVVHATVGRLPWRRRIEELETRIAAIESAMGIQPKPGGEPAQSETAGPAAEEAAEEKTES
ncbi:MAG: hypothetical protein GXP31_10350 [Kiritimatiellaeota bacterium]|nr:hypothetical protein [Kiritimatiellota bacterium]